MFPGLDLCYTDPAQQLLTAGQELDDLDHDLSIRRVKCLTPEPCIYSSVRGGVLLGPTIG